MAAACPWLTSKPRLLTGMVPSATGLFKNALQAVDKVPSCSSRSSALAACALHRRHGVSPRTVSAGSHQVYVVLWNQILSL